MELILILLYKNAKIVFNFPTYRTMQEFVCLQLLLYTDEQPNDFIQIKGFNAKETKIKNI